ncbi:MAG: condensation domain-containing protein [Methylotetracoccus sp.]
MARRSARRAGRRTASGTGVAGSSWSAAPLLRIALLRVDEERYHFLWTHHHLLLDGWSGPLLLQEVFEDYSGITRGEPVKRRPARPYRDYLRWLARQDGDAAEAYWREQLRGFDEPTSLGIEPPSSAVDDDYGEYGEWILRIPASDSARLEEP